MDDTAVSESISVVLIVFLVVVLAGIAASIFFGLIPTDALEKPTLAAFSVQAVDGADSSGNLVVPMIALYQQAGDDLTVEYTEGEHTRLNDTVIRLYDPEGQEHVVQTSVYTRGKDVEKGDAFYIFRYSPPSDGDYWITNNRARVFTNQSGYTEPFDPHGPWRLVIVDEKTTDHILFEGTVDL